MGLLDDLRNQADNQRENEAADAERRAKLEAYYEKSMRPRMIKAFQYLTEFVNHLNYIKLETFVEYPLLPNGDLQRLQQQDYKVVIDSSKALKEIKFTMECALDGTVEFDVFGKDAVLLQVDKIKCYSFRHECKTRKVNMEITSAKFILEGPLPLAVNINADVNESKVKIEIRNFNEPGYAKYVLTAEEFNDEFLDRLGKFVIRQERTLFGGEEISDAAKKVLRDKIIVERRIREQEMLEAEARIKTEEAAANERSAKEQLKRAVNTKVAKGKESLKDMFGKLKKQAGFDFVTPARGQAATAAPKPEQPARGQAATAAPKPEQPARGQAATAAPKPEQPARGQAATAASKPEQPARGQAATAAPKPEQPARGQAATAAPKPEQPARGQATTAASKPEQQVPTQATTATQKPQAPVPANSEQQKQEPIARASKKPQPPKVYTAPDGNPFLTPDEPEPSSEQANDFDSKLNQKEDKTGEKSDSELEDAKTSSSKLSLSPEDLESDLVNIMQRDTPAKPEVKLVHESAGKVKQKPDPDLTQLKIEPESKPASESNPDLELKDSELKIEQLKETSPSKPSRGPEDPDIDLSGPSSAAQEETESDIPLTSMFSRTNKKAEE